MDFGLHVGADGETLENSIDMEVRAGHKCETLYSSSEGGPPRDQDKMTENSSGRELVIIQGEPNLEPEVGMEFESEAAAHAFYSAYAMRVGFITRWSKLCRSRRDKSVIGRAFVCNKEGFRLPDKRCRKGTKPRAPTRVGCKAMIAVRKLSSGKWVISKVEKEHSHPLMTPGKGRKGSIYDQYPNEHERIRDLSQQLLLERRRSAAYKRHLELIFKHIEEHTQNLSKKIQHIVDSVKEIESEK
ncbi:PREDICTED: protein FAR1-RELATED SEQUENCE 5-like isoform X2 [Nelumbo nucifera]|uniref:Protein FAR1-RELATED SEQUENCE 5-like isoform X2 n=1 Tax=Nelumbo nucifera TaxID=4432 RepID=A0A1U8ALF5_NELNU|nr:PREDICTED: protein FAR1-RELATED SEQUENCE 5-like isoform X2 [Nelumbo nucifera]